MRSVAILEDDPIQTETLQAALRSAGYACASAANCAGFLKLIRNEHYDVLVLDRELPDGDGADLIQTIRFGANSGALVLIITAHGDEASVVAALERGADDYLIKPIRPGEFLARLKAHERLRAGGRPNLVDTAPYQFDPTSERMLLADQPLDLSAREVRLARFLFEHAGRIVSRKSCLLAVWGIDSARVQTRTVDTHISRLRAKLHLSDHGWELQSVRQVGYRIRRL